MPEINKITIDVEAAVLRSVEEAVQDIVLDLEADARARMERRMEAVIKEYSRKITDAVMSDLREKKNV